MKCKEIKKKKFAFLLIILILSIEVTITQRIRNGKKYLKVKIIIRIIIE